MSSLVTDDAVRAGVQAVAQALLPQLPALAADGAVYILAEEPRFSSGGAKDLVQSGARANSTALLDGLLRAVPLDVSGPSEEVVHNMHEFVQRGVSVDTVERGYRVGTAFWCWRWARAVQDHCDDLSIAVGVTAAGTTYLLGWLERQLETLGAEGRAETARLAREGALLQLAEVRRVLSVDGDPDVGQTSRKLRYDLSGRHLAFVFSRIAPNEDGPLLDSVARQIATEVSNSRPLIVRADVATAWCWVPVRGDTALTLPNPVGAVIGGQGRVGAGVDGFRDSHREAVEALRVAHLAGYGSSTMTRYDDVAISALCSADDAGIRHFVLQKLGTLANDDEAMAGLRATMSAFFTADSGFRATAKTLGLHHNTVRYRLTQAEKILGRPLHDDRLALELAVHLTETLGAAVLNTVDDHAK